MGAVLHIAVLSLTVVLLARFLPDVRLRGLGTAIVVAIVFSVLNFFLGWLIRALLFVPAILTLGLLFLFIPFLVNTVLLWLTDKLLASFQIRSTRALLVSSAVITAVNILFYAPVLQAASRGRTYDTLWV
ncbi:MAG: phage holin family protein [Myxococcota bacterium]|nr:phage holin family protein [Myxococcota bacterium]